MFPMMPQAHTVSSQHVSVRPSWGSFLVGYLVLALTYHAAEYAMRFHQHIPLFLGLMLVVIPVAFGVARLQGFSRMGAWGMQINRKPLD
jgi:hypothetical protein